MLFNHLCVRTRPLLSPIPGGAISVAFVAHSVNSETQSETLKVGGAQKALFFNISKHWHCQQHPKRDGKNCKDLTTTSLSLNMFSERTIWRFPYICPTYKTIWPNFWSVLPHTKIHKMVDYYFVGCTCCIILQHFYACTKIYACTHTCTSIF